MSTTSATTTTTATTTATTAAMAQPMIDIESSVFAMRFANLLRATRLERGSTFRSLVKASGRRWTKAQLRKIEEGLLPLDEVIVESVTMAYGADLGTILPSRLPVAIVDGGVISAGGVRAVFVPRNEASLLTAYLRLIRSMRRQRKAPMLALRRDDIDVLAEHLEVSGETVIERLTTLMGATLNQRTAILAMFATGAVVIGLAGASVAGPPETTSPGMPDRAQDAVEVNVAVPTPDLGPVNTAVVTVETPTSISSTVPDTVAPDTVAPDTVAPDTVAPDTVAPATVGPDTVAPATVGPATVAPAATTPAPKATPVTPGAPANTTGPVTTPPATPADPVIAAAPVDTTVVATGEPTAATIAATTATTTVVATGDPAVPTVTEPTAQTATTTTAVPPATTPVTVDPGSQPPLVPTDPPTTTTIPSDVETGLPPLPTTPPAP